MKKIIISCNVSEIVFNAIHEMFPDIELTANGNISIDVNTEHPETASINDLNRLAVIALSKLSKHQSEL